MSYEYVDESGAINHVSNWDRSEAENMLNFFNEHGIEVKEQVLKRSR